MAFTKNPTQDSHNVTVLPARGQSFLVPTETSVVQPTTMSYINCFPLKEEMWGEDAQFGIHKREPWTVGTVATGTVTSTGTRGPLVSPTNTPLLFFSKGTTVYKYDYSINTVASLSTRTDFGSGSGTYLIDSTNARRVAFLETYSGVPTYLYSIQEDGTTGATSTDLSSLSLDGAKGLVFIDGYLFAVDRSGTKIYNSAPGGVYTTWNSTDFIDAEQYADRVTMIAKHKNYLVAFGQASVEFFYDAAIEVGSPLARQESYSHQIGLVLPISADVVTYPAVNMCNALAIYGDDIYFIGCAPTGSLSLYRIHNFAVEEVMTNQYIAGLLNDPSSNFRAISLVQVNNNPQVVLEFTEGNPWAYHIIENCWWSIDGDDWVEVGDRIGQAFTFLPYINYSINDSNFAISNPSGDNTQIYAVKADQDHNDNVTATIYSEIYDLGSNRWKSIARLDAIGEYKTNSVTVSINPTPYYNQTFTSMGSQSQATIGYGNNMSWYNAGPVRRFILKMTMEAGSAGIHRGYEIEYNIGVA